MLSKSDIKIRPIKRTDISSVKKMLEELNLYHNDKSKASAQQILDGCFQSKLTIGLVVEYKSKLIGFSFGYDLMNYVRFSRIHFIDYFFIKEKFRSNGIGRDLLDKIISRAQKRKCDLIYVTASNNNQQANSFYRKNGFKLQKPKSHKYILNIMVP